MALPSNTMAKISAAVPQGPHFASKPYWVTINEKGEASCSTLDPASLVLHLARVRTQIRADAWPRDTHSFLRAYPVRLEIMAFCVKASSEGVTTPRREYYAVMTDSLLFEVVVLFGQLNGCFDTSQQVLAAIAYDHWARELGKNPSAEEHRGLLASTSAELATLVAPSL